MHSVFPDVMVQPDGVNRLYVAVYVVRYSVLLYMLMGLLQVVSLYYERLEVIGQVRSVLENYKVVSHCQCPPVRTMVHL